MADTQEPSIEEILASIREIISDDDAAVEKAEEEKVAPLVVAEPAPEPVVQMAPIAMAEPAPAPKSIDDEILDLSAFEKATPKNVPSENPDPLAGINLEKSKVMTVAFTDPDPEPEPTPVAFAPAPEPAPAPEAYMPEPKSTESLLTEHAKEASIDSLTRLAQNIAMSRSGNGLTLEDIVREMLKPMLRDWLDRSLPPMIERMVERELERLVKQAMDR